MAPVRVDQDWRVRGQLVGHVDVESDIPGVGAEVFGDFGERGRVCPGCDAGRERRPR